MTQSLPPSIQVTVDQGKKRLDVFLSEYFADRSRASIQKDIKNGLIILNNRPAIAHQPVRAGDTISFIAKKPPAKKRQQNTVPQASIISEERDLVVVNKPAGLLVHPTETSEEETLVDQLIVKYSELASLGEDPARPAIVHRLDRDVGGIILVPRTWEMYEHLKDLFKTRNIEKKYTALVHGHPNSEEGDITFSISRSKRRPRRMAALPDATGKAAVTSYEVIETFPQNTLLLIKPKTGRMHQIRVHLHAFGLPIVGDPLYHARKRRNELGAAHPLLTATSISFQDITGKLRSYSAPLPDEFSRILGSLRKIRMGQPR
ncbi:MAG TPA: hypothetical protein DHV25_04265 [Candidatus Kerfeldbacteria bacterium]|nr:MAG: Pseudouridine synthase [Parcubacteria group bacterium GW2011_GWC2_49_9]HCJ52903.1 hypothetical protein [Candidatus Kerfeldbacteria bacterium]